MKTRFTSCLGVTACLFITPALAQDRVKEDETNRAPASRAMQEGERGNQEAMRLGINQAISDLLHNPEGLFERLDTDTNGQLSVEEFKRMTSVGSTGTAANTGTTGITGATGATGVSGQAMKTGVGGDPATAPATPQTRNATPPQTEGETTAPTNPTKPNLPMVPANPGLPDKPGQPEAPAAPNNPSNAQPPGTPAPTSAPAPQAGPQ